MINLISQDIFADLKGPKENIICTMVHIRGDFLGLPHGTTPAAVIAKKIKRILLRAVKRVGHIMVSATQA